PAAYPPGAWDRYDTLLTLARARGIGVNFDLTSPAPYWATGVPPRLDIEKNYLPSASEFGAFATAAGTRYSGGYRPPGAAAPVPRRSPAGARRALTRRRSRPRTRCCSRRPAGLTTPTS